MIHLRGIILKGRTNMSDIDEHAGVIGIYRFSGPDSFEPLPLTVLVRRTLGCACAHPDLMGVKAATLRLFQKQMGLGIAPSVSYREGDPVDRYDMSGLFLYVRTHLVILIAGSRMVYASTEAGMVVISTVPLVSGEHQQKEGVLLEEPL